jgi:hypothetical protein
VYVLEEIFKFLDWPFKLREAPPTYPFPTGIERLWQWYQGEEVAALRILKRLEARGRGRELVLYLDEVNKKQRLTIVSRPVKKEKLKKGQGRGVPGYMK